jgi:hypothetical protein
MSCHFRLRDLDLPPARRFLSASSSNLSVAVGASVDRAVDANTHSVKGHARCSLANDPATPPSSSITSIAYEFFFFARCMSGHELVEIPGARRNHRDMDDPDRSGSTSRFCSSLSATRVEKHIRRTDRAHRSVPLNQSLHIESPLDHFRDRRESTLSLNVPAPRVASEGTLRISRRRLRLARRPT